MKKAHILAKRGNGVLTGIRTYDDLLRTFTGDLTLEEIKDELNRRAKAGASASTLALLRSAFKKAVRLRVHDIRQRAMIEEAFKTIRLPKPDKKIYAEEILSGEEIQKILEVAPQRTREIISFLSVTGLRISEALGIRYSNIERKDGFAFIKIIGKGSKERRIFIPIEDFQRIKHAFGGREFLFESSRGGRMSRQNVWNATQRLSRKTGIQFHPHSLRHRFSHFQIVERKQDIKAVSRYLGHSAVGTTLEMYTHAELSTSNLFPEKSK